MPQLKNLRSFFYVVIIITAILACTINSKKAYSQSEHQKTLFKDSFPQPGGYVNDYAYLYSAKERDSLEKIIGKFENSTTIQVALIVFKASMVPPDSLEALTQRVGNTWGVGQKEINNGVVIGICPECRKMTIQNGYGIEKIMSDAETKAIIDGYFIPQFKEARYFEGTVMGLQALIETLTKKWKAQKG